LPDPPEDHEHAGHADTGEPADLVEPAHDLRLPPEEDRGVLLLEIGESRIGPAARREGKARRVEAGALQSLLEAPPSVRVAGEVDKLFVSEVGRNVALVDANERRDDLFAHQARRVDLRLAPARCEPFLGDER
jgi:hypothetical protein